MAKHKRKVRRQRGYAAKRERQGGDSYGTWRDGKRQSPERVAGKVIY